jgi:hypothetical protein
MTKNGIFFKSNQAEDYRLEICTKSTILSVKNNPGSNYFTKLKKLNSLNTVEMCFILHLIWQNVFITKIF